MSPDGPTTLLESPPLATAPRVPQAAILLSFDRLLTAGALYPMGHVRFDAAVQEYRQAASQACGARRVEVESDGDLLIIQDIALDSSHRGQERLMDLFDRLGIQRILIDADTPAEALHRLATGLLRQRREADNDGHLKQATFDDLPVQVAVVPRVFRKRWTDGIDARFVPIIEAILDDAVAACDSPESGRVLARPSPRCTPTARSAWPSPFQSALAMDLGLEVVIMGMAPWNVPSPLPK